MTEEELEEFVRKKYESRSYAQVCAVRADYLQADTRLMHMAAGLFSVWLPWLGAVMVHGALGHRIGPLHRSAL